MNIFILSDQPQKAAREHNDKHVVKMILESGQMLSTAHRMLDGKEYIEKSRTGRNVRRWKHPNSNMESTLYKAVHMNHPCTIWTRESQGNYYWHFELFKALCEEYMYRYNKVHATQEKLMELLSHHPKNIMDADQTPFAQAMPDYCKNIDAVKAYRKYYIHEKNGFANWKGRSKPRWYNA